jgi:hypothetical protein
MIPTVHILVTETDDPNMTLVFQTLRVGFPTAPIWVHRQPMTEAASKRLDDAMAATIPEADTVARTKMTHGEWIDDVLSRAGGPIVFLDTDVIFYAPVEHWQFETGLAGRYIRRFREPFTGCISEPRLHPSLLFVDPAKLSADLAGWRAHFNATRFNPPVTSFRAFTLAERTRAGVVNHFHDTGSAAYQAAGGTPFSESQLDAYTHLFGGTFLPELAEVITDADLAASHRTAWSCPDQVQGAWRAQNEWYGRRAC